MGWLWNVMVGILWPQMKFGGIIEATSERTFVALATSQKPIRYLCTLSAVFSGIRLGAIYH